MAKKSIYEKRADAVKKTAKAYLSGNSNNTMANQISNYQTRLKGAGIDPSQATDKRNWFEKLTNLPEDQNALFDALELINRPQQALFGAIESAQEGGDILEGAKSGITGEEDYYFGDILRNAGVDDTPLFTGPLSGEDRSLADVLGLAGDIFLDPVDIPAFALKPVSAAGKVAKGADAVGDVAKAANVADDVLDATRYAYKFDPLAAMTTKGSKSLLEGAVGGLTKGVGKVVKGTGKAAINAADLSTVKKLATDNKLITKGTKVTKENMPELIEQLGKLGVEVPLKSEAINRAGQVINRAFNYKDSIPGNLYDTITRSDNAIDTASMYGNQLSRQASESIAKYADATGKNADDVNNAVQMLISSKYAPETGVDYYVRNALKNGGKSDIIKGSKEQINDIKKAVEAFVEKTPNVTEDAIKVVPTRGGARIVGKKNLLGAIHNDNSMMKSLSNIKFKNISEFDDDIAAEILKLEDLYKTDNEFKGLVDELEPMYKQYSDYLKGATEGTVDFNPIVSRTGYTRKGTAEEGKEVRNILRNEKINVDRTFDNNDVILEGSKQSFKGRTQSPVAQQAQRDFERNIKSFKEKTQQELDYLKSQKKDFIGTRKANIQKGLEQINVKQATVTQNAKNNIAKLNLSSQKQAGFVKKYSKELDDINDLITEEVTKKASKVSNPKLVENLSKSTDNYVNKIQKLDDIKIRLANPDLKSSQIESLQKQFDKAYDNVIKAKANVVEKTAKINGAVEESFIKEAGKIADKMSNKAAKTQEKLTKAQARNMKALDKIENAKKSYNDIALNLQKQQSNLKLQLEEVERLAKNPEELAKQVEYISEQIAEKERVISVLESIEGKQLYATGFTQGFDDFVNMSSKEAKAMKNYNEILLQAGSKNDDVIKFFKTGESTKLGPNMIMLDEKTANKLSNYLDNMKDLMPENSTLIKDFKNEMKSSKAMAIDKDVLDLISLGANTTKNDANLFVKTINDANNLFKKTSTLSPGFQLRNVTGNMSNMWLSGVPMKDISTSYARSIKLSKPDYIIDLVNKSAKGTLNTAEAADYKIVKQFIESGAMGKGKNIRDLGDLIEKATTDKKSANLLKKTWNSLFEASAKANEKVDNISRLALLSYASENPKYVAKLGAKDAIGAMHEVLFDPQNMSNFEKKYMKKLIPFYTFTKQNLMYQAKNIVNNTTKYNRLMKAFNKSYDAVGEGNYRQYQKENFEIPLFNTGNGVTTLKSNLPVGDLGEYLENPLQRLVSSTTPLIKTPFEQVTGVDTFTGRDISDRGLGQAILDTTGLSNLTTKQYDKLQKLAEAGEIDANTLATLFPSVFRTNDASKIANQQQYEELMAYQEYVKALKDQGIDVPTIKELTSSTQSSIRNMKNYRKKRSR